MAENGHVRLGNYEILEVLGRGGMGTVYRARDTSLDRLVALKVLEQSAAGDPTEMARFEKEARATSALNHPHIIQVIDLATAEHDGKTIHFLVMELVEGRSLREMLEGSTTLSEILEVVAQVADALAKAHEQGIIHRDIKPENVLVTDDGYAKIVDFGIAKLTGSSELRARSIGSQLEDVAATQAGEVMGTLAYMAPEQIRGGEIDQRTDVFALGAILFEAIAGDAPFRAESAPATLRSIMNNDVPAVRHPKRPAPISLENVIHRCLAKDPADRHQSAGEVADVVRSVIDEMKLDPDWVPVERIGFDRTTVLVAVVIALLVILAAILLSST